MVFQEFMFGTDLMNQQGNNVRYGGSDARSGERLAFDDDGDVFVSAKPRWCSSHAFTVL